jgi:DNA-binding LacI/PurR family transcriptional regulator
MKQHQVTIKDIAKELGISFSTVSRALKDHPDISQDTKNQVKEMAQKMGYEPNTLALSLRKSKTNTIGLVIPEIVHFFFSSVISGIEDVAFQKGYNVLVCQTNEEHEREVAKVQALISNRVDGVLVSIAKTTKDYQHLQQFINKGIPVVFFDRVCPDINADRVIVDDDEGAYMVTELLIRRGCKKIAHFAATQNLLIGRNRLAGYRRALEDYQIEFDPQLVLHCDTWELAMEQTEAFMLANPGVDAVFAVNDSTAIAAMKVLQQIGYRIPQDIAVAGFGDGPNALITTPMLTTVEQKGYEMGVEAFNFLVNRIENEMPPDSFQTKVLSPVLVERESTQREATSANV